jgi:hypothetical protein
VRGFLRRPSIGAGVAQLGAHRRRAFGGGLSRAEDVRERGKATGTEKGIRTPTTLRRTGADGIESLRRRHRNSGQ